MKKDNNKLYSGYVIRFNEPDLSCRIFTKESFNCEQFEKLKLKGEIIDYEIDEIGVKITKSV